MSEVVRKARLKEVWVLVSRLAQIPGLDKDRAEEIMREHIFERFQKESTRALTTLQLAQTADWLRAKLPAEARPMRQPGQPSARQLQAIRKMAQTLKLTKKQLENYCERILDHPEPETLQEASIFYQALDALQLHRRKADPMDPQQQIIFCLNHLDCLDAWKAGFVQALAQKIKKGKSLTGRMRDKLDEAYRAAGGTIEMEATFD